MGTLLELINGTLDVLRRLTGQPAPLQAITPVGVRGEKPLDVKDSIIATRRTLETAALYSAAQLALWVARPDTGDEGGVSGEVEMDEPSSDISLGPSHDARKAPTSFSLAERLRRGMTGEIASDLISALNKARPILTKADSMVGDKVDGELMVLLAGFIKERVAASEA
jgi:nuclear pore complex protein Nup188